MLKVQKESCMVFGGLGGMKKSDCRSPKIVFYVICLRFNQILQF